MNRSLFLVIVFTVLLGNTSCTILAATGYALSSPPMRSFLIRTGLGNLISRKSVALYDASNFRYSSDQGTDIRKAQMDDFDIVELNRDPNRKRTGLPASDLAFNGEEDRMYSERVFGVLSEMDKNACASRLLCEIGADPKSFGFVGFKIHHYLKSVPPVTWNSATFPYLEAFQAGLGRVDACNQHYTNCNYDLRRAMKFLWFAMKPNYSKTKSES